jgi:hypothetical protein
VSSLVTEIGGLGTYPSTVPRRSTYEALVDIVAHEWLHNYFFFYPLGRHFTDSQTTRTLNETAANIGGHEIGRLIRQRFPLPESGVADTDREREEPKIDFKTEMRALRLDVDRLLGEGKIDEAETLMEERRKFLAENGYYIRKINQAYFAFHGLYGTGAASSSPIGPKLEEIRQREPSLGEFIRAVSRVTSEADLDRLLASLSGSATLP